MTKKFIVIRCTSKGVEVSMEGLDEIETNKLEQIRDQLWKTFQKVQEELVQRYNYEESGDDMEDDWNEDYWDDVVPEWEVAPAYEE